jgi:CDP-diacylglycerol--glycerol-3-phosphate 3-phosphatidyltransferase
LTIRGPLRPLFREVLAAALVGAIGLTGGYVALRRETTLSGPEGWFLVSTAVFTYFLAHLSVRLDANRLGPSHDPHPTLGPANHLTLGRALLASSLAGFVVLASGDPGAVWVPGSLYLLIVVGDALDGLVARRTGRVTELGGEMDMATDRMALLAAIAVAVVHGRLHAGFLVLGILPYLFIGHLHLRRRSSARPLTLAPDWKRQLVGTLLTLFLVVALLPVLPPEDLRLPGVLLFVLVLGSFARDWWQLRTGVVR